MTNQQLLLFGCRRFVSTDRKLVVTVKCTDVLSKICKCSKWYIGTSYCFRGCWREFHEGVPCGVCCWTDMQGSDEYTYVMEVLCFYVFSVCLTLFIIYNVYVNCIWFISLPGLTLFTCVQVMWHQAFWDDRSRCGTILIWPIIIVTDEFLGLGLVSVSYG
jgi:hypothetical protein